jgi:hypothetical protein
VRGTGGEGGALPGPQFNGGDFSQGMEFVGCLDFSASWPGVGKGHKDHKDHAIGADLVRRGCAGKV